MKKKVISWNNKGLINIFKSHIKLILILFICVILVILFFIIKNNSDKNVLTINNVNYTESDFNIYLYSSKYNYFGSDDYTKDDLNTIYDEEENITVGEYLKTLTLNDIKTSSAILKMADANNIELSKSDLKELKTEKKKFINTLGGKKEYKKFLKDNDTTDKAYDKMSKSDKLYKKILEELYSSGKLNDLTDKEKEEANSSYYDNYYKIEQVIFTIVDLESGKSLNTTIINQKETLAKTVYNNSKTEDFSELVKKYSEDAINKEAPYYEYYKKGELLTELEEELDSLDVNQVSSPIKTKYAYHVIKRLELDDAKLEDYYDDLREEKCLNDLREYYESIKILYRKAYKNLKVK